MPHDSVRESRSLISGDGSMARGGRYMPRGDGFRREGTLFGAEKTSSDGPVPGHPPLRFRELGQGRPGGRRRASAVALDRLRFLGFGGAASTSGGHFGHHTPLLTVFASASKRWPTRHCQLSGLRGSSYSVDRHLPPSCPALARMPSMVPAKVYAHTPHQRPMRISAARIVHRCPLAHCQRMGGETARPASIVAVRPRSYPPRTFSIARFAAATISSSFSLFTSSSSAPSARWPPRPRRDRRPARRV